MLFALRCAPYIGAVQSELFDRDPEVQRNNLIFCLNVYALTLCTSDRVLEAHSVET